MAQRKIRHGDTARLLGVVATVVVVATLYFARVVFIPLALALLVSLLLTPVISLLERIKIPRVIAILLVIIAVTGAVVITGWIIARQVASLTGQLPTYKKTLEEKIHGLALGHSKGMSNVSATFRELGSEVAATIPGSGSPSDAGQTRGAPGTTPSHPLSVEVVPPDNPVGSLQSVVGPLATIGLVALFTIFILFGREDLRNRLIHLVGGGRLNVMTQALDEATRRINRYLFLQLLVNSGYGIVIGAGLYFIGVPNAFLWGFSATILRFLPYIGPPLSAIVPIGLSLAVFPGWHHALLTAGLFVVLELVVANLVEPFLYGAHIGISALAILVAAVFWTLIWGFPGLILSTPLTVCLVVLGRYVPSFGSLNVILGDEPVLSPEAQYYQRLLAADSVEARQILVEYLKNQSLDELYASVMIPALGLAEQDRHRHELDEETTDFIYQSTREIVEELGDVSLESNGSKQAEVEAGDSPSNGGTTSKVDILCIPARDEADDVVALLLAQLLVLQGWRTTSIRIGRTADMLSEVVELKPKLVCISALPPFAVDHARALYGKLRAQSPKLNIFVCLWHLEGDVEKMARRLKLASGHRLFTTLQQVLNHVVSNPTTRGDQPRE